MKHLSPMEMFLIALVSFFVLALIFQYSWNNGAVKAVTVFQHVDYVSAILVLVVLVIVGGLATSPKVNVGEINLIPIQKRK